MIEVREGGRTAVEECTMVHCERIAPGSWVERHALRSARGNEEKHSQRSVRARKQDAEADRGRGRTGAQTDRGFYDNRPEGREEGLCAT